jgi:hypothetical protein
LPSFNLPQMIRQQYQQRNRNSDSALAIRKVRRLRSAAGPMYFLRYSYLD